MNLANLNINENKPVNNFNYLLKLDDNFNKIINEVSLKKNKNYAKYMISSFHETFLEEFNKFLEETDGDELDIQTYKYIHNKLFNLDEKLIIKNFNDIETLSIIIQLASIFMKEAFINKDIDCFFESFYQLEYNIKEKNLIAKEITQNISISINNNHSIYEVYSFEH